MEKEKYFKSLLNDDAKKVYENKLLVSSDEKVKYINSSSEKFDYNGCIVKMANFYNSVYHFIDGCVGDIDIVDVGDNFCFATLKVVLKNGYKDLTNSHLNSLSMNDN